MLAEIVIRACPFLNDYFDKDILKLLGQTNPKRVLAADSTQARDRRPRRGHRRREEATMAEFRERRSQWSYGHVDPPGVARSTGVADRNASFAIPSSRPGPSSSDIVKDQAITEGVIGGHFWIASGHLATHLLARLIGRSGLPMIEGPRHGTSATMGALWRPCRLPNAAAGAAAAATAPAWVLPLPAGAAREGLPSAAAAAPRTTTRARSRGAMRRSRITRV